MEYELNRNNNMTLATNSKKRMSNVADAGAASAIFSAAAVPSDRHLFVASAEQFATSPTFPAKVRCTFSTKQCELWAK
jgi:hypothetical protein